MRYFKLSYSTHGISVKYGTQVDLCSQQDLGLRFNKILEHDLNKKRTQSKCRLYIAEEDCHTENNNLRTRSTILYRLRLLGQVSNKVATKLIEYRIA